MDKKQLFVPYYVNPITDFHQSTITHFPFTDFIEPSYRKNRPSGYLGRAMSVPKPALPPTEDTYNICFQKPCSVFSPCTQEHEKSFDKQSDIIDHYKQKTSYENKYGL